LADVCGAIHLHHDAALAGQVAAECATPGRRQQCVRRVRSHLSACFVDHLLQQHPLRGA
jgi:hypothetical protein